MTESNDQSSSSPSHPPQNRGSTASTSEQPKNPVKGKWKRRLVRTLIALITVGVALRILLSLMLPWTLRRVANIYGLDITYERSDLYLTSGDAGLWHVKVTQAGSGQVVADVDYCRGDISSLSLLRGQLVVQRIEADGVELTLQRDADGTLPLLKRLLARPKAAPSVKSTSVTRINFAPPVALDALRLSHVKTHIIDLAVSPALDAEVEMNLRFSDLASPIRPAKLNLELLPSPFLDSMVMTLEGRSTSQSLDASFALKALGLHPKLLAGYLSTLGVRPMARGLSVQGEGKIATRVVSGANDAVAGTLVVQKMSLVADGADAATLDHITINLDSVSPNSVSLGKVAIEDGTFVAQRTARGWFSVAGLELTPAENATEKSSSTTPSSTTAAPGTTVMPSGASGTAFRWSIGEVALKNLRASLIDAAVTPAADLQFVVNTMSIKNVVDDVAKPSTPLTLTGDFSAPGISESININGTCDAFAAIRKLQLQVKAAGVRPDALAAYLDRLGLESELKEGEFTCKLLADVSMLSDQTVAANARITDIQWNDGKELLSLADVGISGLSLGADSIRVNEISVVGPHVSARRDETGALEAVGLKLKPMAAGTSQLSSTSSSREKVAGPAKVANGSSTTHPAIESDPLASLPRLDIAKFRWSGIQLRLEDAAAPRTTSLSIEDAGVEIDNLHVDLHPGAPIGRPGKVRMWMKAPGLAGNLGMQGTITPHPGGLLADVQVSGDKLSVLLAAPYLKALNIEPTLSDGALTATAHVDVTQTPHELSATASVSNVTLTDDGVEVFGIDKAAVTGISMKTGLLTVDAVELGKPRGKFVREESGALSALGFRLLPVPVVAKKPQFGVGKNAPDVLSVPASVAIQAQPIATTRPAAEPEVVALKKFSIRDGAFSWIDRSVKPVAETTARVNGDVDGINWGRPAAEPIHLSFALKADGIVDEAKLEGVATLAPDSAKMKVQFGVSGLRQGALISYLPPGFSLELKDGQLKGALSAGVEVNPNGGLGGHFTFSDLDYRDGQADSPLFRLDAVKMAVSRVDIPAGVVSIDEISVTGAETSARKGADGAIHLLGVAIKAVPTTQPATQPTVTGVPTAPLPSLPPIPGSITAAPPADGVSPSPAVPLVVVKPKYPLITLGKFDLNLRKLTLTDETQPDAAPLTISDLRFYAAKPIEVLGPEAANRPAIELALSLKLEKILDQLSLSMHLSPFAGEPVVVADVTGSGLHGDGLLSLLPELKDDIDASKLTSGLFHAHAGVKLKLDRFDPLDFNPNRAFDVDVVLKDIEFRDREKGQVLVGIEEVRSEGIHVHPVTGKVLVKALEVSNITAIATRENDGIHAVGIVLKIAPSPTTRPAGLKDPTTTRPALASAAVSDSTVLQKVPTTVNLEDQSEIRINRVSVNGLNVRVEDNTVAPPLVVPLNELDVEIQNLSSRALTEVRPKTKFSMLVGAGKVLLPRKGGAAIGMVTETPSGRKIDPLTGNLEERDLFSQIQVDGELVFYPALKGWIKTTISAFDLAALSSEAKAFDVTLGGGVFDASIDTRLPGDGSERTDSHFTFTDLDLSEATNGPIRSFFDFPSPLNVVIGLLQDADGSLDVPVAISLQKGKLSTAELAGAGVHAVGTIVGKAIAGAPLKVANVAGSLLNLGGEKKIKKEEPVTIAFAAGDDGLSSAAEQEVGGLVRRLHANPALEVTLRSELSTADVVRAELRANPTQQECRELIGRLTRRKGDLIRKRVDLIGQARGMVASRSAADAAPTLDQLRAAERDLAAAEDALDKLYELQRPGASRQAGRRTRQAALEIANSRGQAIRDLLLSAGIPKDRVNLTKAQFKPVDKSGGGNIDITVTVKRANP